LQYSAVTLFGSSTTQTNVGTYPECTLVYNNHFGLKLYERKGGGDTLPPKISHGLLINAQLLTPGSYDPSPTQVNYNVKLTADKAGSDESDIFTYLFEDIANTVYKSGFDAIGSFTKGTQKKLLSEALDTLTKTYSVNVKEARRRIAGKVIEDEVYKF